VDSKEAIHPIFRVPVGVDLTGDDAVRAPSRSVVLGCHYTNTPGLVKDQVTAILDGEPIGLTTTNAVLRLGDGDR
jgi:hypothetical protein